MSIQKEELLKMAKLSRLIFSDSELEKMGQSLEQLVGHLDSLKKLDLSGIEPMTSVDSVSQPLRPDIQGIMLTKEQGLKNAPDVNLEHFSIPKVIGG